MKSLGGYRPKLLVVGIVYCSIFILSKPLAGQVPEASNIGQESSEVIITIAGQEHRYQPQPELGFVVMAQDNAGAIASVYRDLRLFTQNEITAVGGRDRQGLWIVESRQSAAQNEAAIKTLGAQRQVRYVSPLFSSNGETEAIIPEIVVRVTAGTEQEELEQICQMMKLHIKRRMIFTEQEYLVEVLGKDAEAVFAALIELNQIESVEWAAPNVITRRKHPEAPVLENSSQGEVYLFNAPHTPRTTGFIPDDEYFPMQWHLHNTGQSGGTPGADINAPEAWEITAGDSNIVVCVQDTGVDLDHPDLINNLVPGYDFYDNDDSPNPLLNSNSYEAHGTACSGLVAAEGNNGIGVTGVAWNCRLMPTRDGTAARISVADVAEGFRWAAANGADVLSYSMGWSNPQPIIYSAIVDITEPDGIGRDGKGCVVCVAAGNTKDRIPSTSTAAYPEVIGIGATDDNDECCWYSSYGPELDLTAPAGSGIVMPNFVQKQYVDEFMRLSTDLLWTTDITGDWGFSKFNENTDLLDYTEKMCGTSGACPIASGVAALILSIEPNLTNEEVRHFLCRSAKDLGEPGRDDYYGWGRVDARAALDMVLAKRCDLNNNWKVDFEDLLILIGSWGTTESSADIAPAARRDGIVDEQDLELMMQYWQTEIPELGLIAHWKLDEAEGDIAYDSAGNYDAALMGNPVWQPDGGMVAGTLQFDGIDDYVSTDPVLNPADGSFSVFAWIKGGAPGQVVISQTDGANWLLADPSGGNLTTELKGSGRGAAALLSQTAIADGNWHRVGFVWNGSNRTLYVDDVEIAGDTQTDLASSEGGLYIGAASDLEPGGFYSGLIDDVRIYDRAVTP